MRSGAVPPAAADAGWRPDDAKRGAAMYLRADPTYAIETHLSRVGWRTGKQYFELRGGVHWLTWVRWAIRVAPPSASVAAAVEPTPAPVAARGRSSAAVIVYCRRTSFCRPLTSS